MENHIKLGISACLTGKNVRYDGGHKLDPFLTDTLGKYAEYVLVCPETECGMSIPREPIRLEGNLDNPRLVTVRTRQVYTDIMVRWTSRRVTELEKENLCGFIFKEKSPSCGVYQTKIHHDRGILSQNGTGIFARIFTRHFPLIPVETEIRLREPEIRENFIRYIFAYQRLRELRAKQKLRSALLTYHSQHKLLILAHSPIHYQIMGKLMAEAKNYSSEVLYNTYHQLLAQALKQNATVGKHINVLQHAMGYFKKQLSSSEKQEFTDLCSRYDKGDISWMVLLNFVNHYVYRYDQHYLKQQYYLNPHPLELRL